MRLEIGKVYKDTYGDLWKCTEAYLYSDEYVWCMPAYGPCGLFTWEGKYALDPHEYDLSEIA